MQIRKIIKEGAALVVNFFYGDLLQGASILMYHSVGENDKFSTVTPKNFEQQLQFLKKHNYTLVTLREIVRRRESGESLKNCVAITFDDGYHDFYTTVFPLLQKYRVPAAVFVVTDFLGKNMTTRQGEEFVIVGEKQIHEMSKSPYVEIFAHTKTHPKFSEISLEEACIEINHSRLAIEQITGKQADIFAYPFGVLTEEIVSYFYKNNDKWRASVTVEPGLVMNTTSIMKLNRNSIDSEVGLFQFRMKISDGVLPWVKIKKLFKNA